MAAFINNGIKQEILGESVWDGERLWDKMFYGNHDPGGALANAIAGVDIALWDLKGKLLGLPVYQLLGGMYPPSRDRQDPRSSRLAYPSTAPSTRAGIRSTPNGLIPNRYPILSGSSP